MDIHTELTKKARDANIIFRLSNTYVYVTKDNITSILATPRILLSRSKVTYRYKDVEKKVLTVQQFLSLMMLFSASNISENLLHLLLFCFNLNLVEVIHCKHCRGQFCHLCMQMLHKLLAPSLVARMSSLTGSRSVFVSLICLSMPQIYRKVAKTEKLHLILPLGLYILNQGHKDNTT